MNGIRAMSLTELRAAQIKACQVTAPQTLLAINAELFRRDPHSGYGYEGQIAYLVMTNQRKAA